MNERRKGGSRLTKNELGKIIKERNKKSRPKGRQLTQNELEEIKKIKKKKEERNKKNRLTSKNLKESNVKKFSAARLDDIFIINNIEKRKKFFGPPLILPNNVEKLKKTNPNAFDWHTNGHGDVVACVPSRNHTISTECLVRNNHGKLISVTYKLQYPQALLFSSLQTHREPQNRNTSASLFSLRNKMLYKALINGQLKLDNVHSLRKFI